MFNNKKSVLIIHILLTLGWPLGEDIYYGGEGSEMAHKWIT